MNECEGDEVGVRKKEDTERGTIVIKHIPTGDGNTSETYTVNVLFPSLAR